MIKNKNSLFAIALTGVLLLASCESWIDPDLNDSPNKVEDVPMKVILPAAEAGLAYSQGGELCRYSSIWMQQIAGAGNHSAKHEVYNVLEGDFNNVWKWYTYAGQLMDLNAIIEKSTSEEERSPYYEGIAKTLFAYKIMQTTDFWGDVPLSEAFKGADIPKPRFDSQESVYEAIETMLNEAISALASPKEGIDLLPGSDDDFFYEGNPGKWTKAAYALKARMHLHLAEQKGAGAYTEAIAACKNAFSSNSEDLEFSSWGLSANQNPMYQFHDQRNGYLGGVGAKLINMMNGNGDPRLKVYADTLTDTLKVGEIKYPPGKYVGVTAGGLYQASKIGSYFRESDSPVSLISYVEVKFIEAEALFRTGDAAAAATAYNDAVKASLAKYDVSDAEWEAINAAETETTINLTKIMDAKYIGLFLNCEVFADWRRRENQLIVGNPNSGEFLQVAVGAVTPNRNIPRRFLYPTAARLYGDPATFPKGKLLTDRVWWDVAQ